MMDMIQESSCFRWIHGHLLHFFRRGAIHGAGVSAMNQGLLLFQFCAPAVRKYQARSNNKPWLLISHYPGAKALCTSVCMIWRKETMDFLSSVFSWQMIVRNKFETPQRILRTQGPKSLSPFLLHPDSALGLINSWSGIVLTLLNAEITVSQTWCLCPQREQKPRWP